MAELIDTLRAIVRDELARTLGPERGIVSQLHPRESDSSAGNHQVNVRLPNLGVELQHVPVVVGRLGLAALPQVGDAVLVVFIQGDLNAPVVVGALYDASVQPPVAKAGELVYIPSDAGDDASLRRVHVALGADVRINLDDETLTIQLGGTEVVVAKDGDVTVTSANQLTLKSQGDALFESGGNVEIKAQGRLTLSGASTTVEGQGALKLKGATLSLAGTTQFSPS